MAQVACSIGDIFTHCTPIEATKGTLKQPYITDTLVFTPNMHAPFQTFNNVQQRIINKQQ